MMKWLIGLMVLMLVASPAFAQEILLNPSFELTQNDSSGGRLNPNNIVIPQYWFIGDGFTDLLGVADEVNWTLSLGFVNATAGFGGGYAMQLGDDYTNSHQADLMQTFTVDTSKPVNLTFYVNMNNSDPLLNGYNQAGQGFWTYVYNGNDFFQIGLNKTGSFYINGGVFDSTSATDVGGGWWKVNLIFNVTQASSVLFFETPDFDFNLNYYPLSNVTLYNPSAPAPPVPPITGQITGATASIIGFLPLLIGVGIIVMVARKIEDMNSTEDFIAVIVGTGLAIVFLGVFAAIIAGLI